jgi:hypothetical protein
MREDPDLLISKAATMWSLDRNVEALLRHLRRCGCTKGDCMSILRRAGIAEKRDVKRIVHESDAWEDRRNADEELHATADEALSDSQARPIGKR